MDIRILSLSEITVLEDAVVLDAPAFEHVVQSLLARWAVPLRDTETATRLLYVLFAAQTEFPVPQMQLTLRVPEMSQILNEAGGEEGLTPDALFAFGLLVQWHAFDYGDEATWKKTGRRWMEESANREPGSLLFREWQFFLGDAPTTQGARIYIRPEIHARYFGRGLFGARMKEYLLELLK